jgi:hypothetical protein
MMKDSQRGDRYNIEKLRSLTTNMKFISDGQIRTLDSG